MLVVIALGGNAILQRGQPMEAGVQRENIRQAAKAIAEVAKKHQVVLTHGNGPQVGLLALQNEAYKEVKNYPLDLLGAQTQGMIGSMFAQELRNFLPNHEICTLATHTLVDSNDPAFTDPDKFIGPVYSAEEADKVRAEKSDWVLKADGKYFRRVVPSPIPAEILELTSVKQMLASGEITLICGGGGGVPVQRDAEGKISPVEAVVDKDRASRVLAEGINADALILLTDVPAVETNYGQPDSKKIREATPEAFRAFDFAAGSMGPKVEAICGFVEGAKNRFAAIGALDQAADIIRGEAGTVVKCDVKDGVIYS